MRLSNGSASSDVSSCSPSGSHGWIWPSLISNSTGFSSGSVGNIDPYSRFTRYRPERLPSTNPYLIRKRPLSAMKPTSTSRVPPLGVDLLRDPIPPREVTASSRSLRSAWLMKRSTSSTLLLPEAFGPTSTVRGPSSRSSLRMLLKLRAQTLVMESRGSSSRVGVVMMTKPRPSRRPRPPLPVRPRPSRGCGRCASPRSSWAGRCRPGGTSAPRP